MLQSLQEESHKAQVQKSEALSRLQTVDSSKQGLEEKVTELQRTNTQLQVCLPSQEYVSIFHTKQWFMCVQVELAGERHRAEDQVSRLEVELEALKERLQERAESQVYGVVCV